MLDCLEFRLAIETRVRTIRRRAAVQIACSLGDTIERRVRTALQVMEPAPALNWSSEELPPCRDEGEHDSDDWGNAWSNL